MGRGGGGDKPDSLEAMGVPQQEIDRLTLIIQERELESITAYLIKTMTLLNKALGREGKVKGSPLEMAATICSMADNVAGLYKYNERRLNEVFTLLTEAGIEERDAFCAAVEARYILTAYAKNEVAMVTRAKHKEEKPEEPNKKAKGKKK